ncbi:MAG: hypothetical protein R2845_11295 [Thermomicrobiales bacterium]
MSAGPFEPPSYPHLAEESELFLTPPPPRQESRSTFFSMLKGGFLRLWIAQALSQTANNVVNFALLLLVTQIIETHGVSGRRTRRSAW